MSVIEGSQKDIDDVEIKIIASVPKEERYNISLGGGAWMKGRNHTSETKLKMSKSRIGKKRSSEMVARLKKNRKGKGLGAKNFNTKLTVEQVREIKFIHLKEKLLTNKLIGQLYGVNWRTISQIKTGKNWSYVLEDKVEAIKPLQGG